MSRSRAALTSASESSRHKASSGRSWRGFFDEREVFGDDGRLRIVYVTEDTIVGGGHRVVFEHLNGLAARGHDAQLWTLGPPPDWFELRCPVRSFADYADLEAALAPLQAIKVATWWKTSAAIWRASVLNGLPVYLVQDIETSYYRDDPALRYEVLDSYRPEFRYLTTSTWNREHLLELGLDAELISPGIDAGTFRPLSGTSRHDDMLLAVGRSNPLKNLRLTLDAWRRLPHPRPELCLFGTEPELAREPGIRYVLTPSDEEVNNLLNQATVFLQTSSHEGFCLPILEAMAAGSAVVCTDAHGNRDFCTSRKNCVMPVARTSDVSAAVAGLLTDPARRKRLGDAGIDTAKAYDWESRIDALERFMLQIATSQILRDPRCQPVEHPEPYDEDCRDDGDRHQQRRRRAQQACDARRGVGDEGVPKLLEDYRQRVEHVDVQQRRAEVRLDCA